jgi:hypothetical protein
MTPNIIHTMKQTVKARVLTISTDHAWRGMGGAEGAMDLPRRGVTRLSAGLAALNILPSAMRGAAEERWSAARP